MKVRKINEKPINSQGLIWLLLCNFQKKTKLKEEIVQE